MRESLIHGGAGVRELLVVAGKTSSRIRELMGIAAERGIPVRRTTGAELSRFAPDVAHQGIAAVIKGFTYHDLGALIDGARRNPGYRTLVALDHITDEGNLGSFMRTAAFFGVDGLILPRDRSAGVTPRVLKRCSGAHVHLPVARVVNLVRSLEELDREGFWVVGASGDGRETVYRFDWRRDVVLVLGNEQRGMSPSVGRCCHEQVGIPGCGKVESLNVTVAGGVVLSEIVRQRTGAGAAPPAAQCPGSPG